MSADIRIVEVADGALADSKLRPVACSGSEGLSELFQFSVEMIYEEATPLDVVPMLGKQTTIKLNSTIQGGSERFVHGCVSSIECVGSRDGQLHYEATIVPELWKSSLAKKTKTHVYKNTKLDAILMDMIKQFDGDVKVKNLCKCSESFNFFDIQYNVSDFTFITRMMSNFGVSYYFEHAEGSHTLVLFNGNAGFVSRGDTLTYNLGEPLMASESVGGWYEQVSAFHAGGLVEDFDLAKVSSKQEKYNAPKPLSEFSKNEAHRYARGVVNGADQSTQTYTLINERTQAKANFERGHTAHKVVTLRSNTPSIYPGQKIEVDSDTPSGETQFVVDSIEHSARSSIDSGSEYNATLFLLPADIEVQPPEVVRQPLYSQLTGIVTKSQYNGGKKPDYATVCVSFPWDDTKETFWIPVAQSFGGEGKSGSLFLPQVNDTVLVTFMNGDTRRPVVSGVLFNGKHKTPPFDNGNPQGLRMGLKAPSGSEWSFSEKSGEEEIYFHSSKDMNKIVDNDDTTHVKHDQKLNVDNDQTTEVKGEQKLTVHKNQTNEIKKNQNSTIQKDQNTTIKSNQTVQVDKDAKFKVGNNYNAEAGQKIELKVGPNTVTIDTSKIELKGPTSSVTIDASGINIKSNGMVNVDGTQVTAKSKAMTEVSSSGMTKVGGSIVMIN